MGTITLQSVPSKGARWLQKLLESAFEMKIVIARHSGKAGVVAEANMLNRVIRAVPAGWEYECDKRHAEIILEELQPKDCQPVGTPGVEETLNRNAEEKAQGAIPLSQGHGDSVPGIDRASEPHISGSSRDPGRGQKTLPDHARSE